jgi:hypothetical protein
MAISIDLPPVGVGDFRRWFITDRRPDGRGGEGTPEIPRRRLAVPRISAKRPPHASGNVSRIELLGASVWSQLNHYLLLIEVDIGDPRIDRELTALLPKGSKMSAIGTYESLLTWPETRPA